MRDGLDRQGSCPQDVRAAYFPTHTCLFIVAYNRYKHMVQLPILDETLYNLQRQGRISFYVSA